MNYFILTSQIKPGNSLQRAVEELVNKVDHRINSDPDQFEKDLNEHVRKLNAQYPRCAPVQLSHNRRHILTRNETDFSFYLTVKGWYIYIHFHKIIGEATL
jgi:hypothetical protein